MRNSRRVIGAVIGTVLLACAGSAQAQLDEFKVACELAVGKAAAKLQKAEVKKLLRCIKGEGDGTLTGTAEACLLADPKSKIQKAIAKYVEVDDTCPIPRPEFGYERPDQVPSIIFNYTKALLHDTFGNDLDTSLANCTSDEAMCSCQRDVTKAVEKLVSLETKMVGSCRKEAIPLAMNATAIGDCIDSTGNEASLASDSKEKIAKQRAKIIKILTEDCGSVALATAFPGDCATALPGTLGVCLAREAACRVCLTQRESSRLTDVDCDTFDDGLANASCVYQFATSQTISAYPITCSSVENTATYTQCNDFMAEGRRMANGVNCGGWSTTPSPNTDHAGLCNSLTGSTSFEVYYACDVTQPRFVWNAYNWTPFDDNGFSQHLRCYY